MEEKNIFENGLISYLTPVFVGATLRIIAIINNPHVLIWDEISFHNLAVSLFNGQPYGLPFWPPGWPFLISFIYRVTNQTNPEYVLWFNCVISTLTLIIYGNLAKRYFSPKIAIFSMWIMAIMPSYLLANLLLIYEVWMHFLLILVTLVSSKMPWSWFRSVSIVLLVSALTLIRPTYVLLPIVFWLVGAIQGKNQPLKSLILIQLGVLIAISPWIIYTSVENGRFVPIALQGGLHLWLANNPNATGTHMSPPSHYYLPEYEAVARSAALEYILQNPQHLFTILPAKIYYMFRAEAWTQWVFYKTEPVINPKIVLLITWMSNLSYYFILIFSVIGIIVVLHKDKKRLAPLILFIYGVVVQIALFTGQLKYRWPLQFILIMYAGVAISWIFGTIFRRKKRNFDLKAG